MQKPVSLPTSSTSSSSCTPAQPEEIFGLPKAESLTRSLFLSLFFIFFLLHQFFLGKRQNAATFFCCFKSD